MHLGPVVEGCWAKVSGEGVGPGPHGSWEVWGGGCRRSRNGSAGLLVGSRVLGRRVEPKWLQRVLRLVAEA